MVSHCSAGARTPTSRTRLEAAAEIPRRTPCRVRLNHFGQQSHDVATSIQMFHFVSRSVPPLAPSSRVIFCHVDPAYSVPLSSFLVYKAGYGPDGSSVVRNSWLFM